MSYSLILGFSIGTSNNSLFFTLSSNKIASNKVTIARGGFRIPIRVTTNPIGITKPVMVNEREGRYNNLQPGALFK